MATLVSTNVTASQTGGWPQIMTVVQEFDHPVVVSEDFQVIFYAKNEKSSYIPGQMASVPVQYVPTQLTYTVQVSPFADGDLGILTTIGFIQDIYGNPVDLKVGDDFDVYNTTIRPYYSDPYIETRDWLPGPLVPPSAICPDNVPPRFVVGAGPWNKSMQIQDGMWAGGNFYMWVNYAWKPDQEEQGIPFVWEPPFYYSFSQFGIPFNQTISPEIPPYPLPTETILNNIISSGTQDGWDTCGWIEDYPKWQGRIQVWVFGSDVFAEPFVPWTFPGVASPTGDLSPFSQFGFPLDSQLQFFLEQPFTYVAP